MAAVDAVAANFCATLTEACAKENKLAFASWSASNSVDNPNPMGAKLGAQIPNRTFRYGMPAFQAPRPSLGFRVSPNKSSSFRTPVEQAAEVAKGKSSVCWGAHMSDMARHIIPSLAGQAFVSGDQFERALGRHLPWFVAIWVDALRSSGLRDAAGGLTWHHGNQFNDQLHVELPGAKIPQTDPRATACVIEYVRLVNTGQFKRNTKFEGDCEQVLKTHLNKISVP